MSIGDIFRSIIDTKFCGEETIRTQVRLFDEHRRRYPNRSQHFCLAMTWLSRMSLHGVDINDPIIQQQAYNETFLFSCLEAPECARALGLYTLFKERRDVVEAYPVFQEEFNILLAPIFKAEEEGRIKDIYRELNPEQGDEEQP